ncbi:MAG: MBG domain-containing protein [Candidatus Sulfotelmatobacter sp.]
MKKLLLISLLLMFGSLAFGQINLPPCDPNNVPPNCTDYFGVANWANSPLPAGAIAGFTIVSAGSGYSTPFVSITDATGTAAGIPTVTVDATGAIATVSGGGGGAGYIAPQITIVDVGPSGTIALPTCGALTQPACGSGAIVTATIGAPLVANTGMRKFLDPLPDLRNSLATPDTTTFPGADYYVIALMQYKTQMHSDLPLTTLRGYCQLIGTATSCTPSYLGPVILATKNRPVRVLFKNMLPTGAGGNLFLPVDTTYMGAGSPYTQNRATLHLHGGATPWISDGTPHQWTAPAGEVGPVQKGDSTQPVPDMWFDQSNGYALIPACAGQSTCAAIGTSNPVNDPGPGAMTFFWTNQQGGRLMFYHDHAYGITRLNVYAGEAAGYLLGDPVEEDALQAATVPGTLGAALGGTTAADLTHLIPLVIQDKTFVPSASQLAVEDPTWVAGRFGTTPGLANPGDLWFPHVYTPNQNPADVGGANAFGRWDYGPWTLPGNQTVLLAATPTVGDVTIPCESSAFPNAAVNCPITPNPSGTPESFMDTPLVNGMAYPVLHVAPEAYRFRILSAGNDRSWNLQLYVADSTVTTPDGRTNTEVKMVPAIQPAAGSLTPLCSQLTPITNTTLFMGLATAILDGSGNPINGTGLPAGCWPNFGAGSQTAGIPIQQTMWAADGRAGGAPDPTTAGPPFIQIGTEGGLLPAPVVIPSMPTGYEANTRSVTITNVSVHGLWLGPAERADVIVDFSKFAGKTLILYNDAPTPAPAVDSRLDYFTGDGDQTPIGGAPNTLPGYGPNTRTIMQIVVGAGTPTNSFSLSTLRNALPSIFAQTQPVPIVPEPTYPPASGGYSAIPTYSLITDASLTFYPIGSTTPVTYTDERKTIQELFTLDYGRMNATLGVELPLTNFLTQTTIPLGYIDPPTEIINQGATQLWHITHNGVDTHFIHFHLFNVQVINRSAWDGTKRPPDQNELGWKDTVRMNPLEDILVALKPIQPVPPFPLRDSYRLMDVTMPAGSNCPAITVPGTPTPAPCSIFTNLDPATNVGTPTPNKVINLGWEYVWHCHILGHEENDMMRAIAFNVPPETPSNLAATAATTGLNLTWTDNSASETGFTLQRDTTAAFAAPTPIFVGPSTPTDANGQGITWGGPITYNDTTATAGPYFYRVQAFKPDASYWTGAIITSPWSNIVSFGGTSASVSPTALAFGTVPLNTISAVKTVTLSNKGTASFTYSTAILGANLLDFMVSSDSCGGTAAAGANCVIGVTFTPTLTPAQLEAASLTITTTDPANPTLTVSLTGTGGTLQLLTITANNATMRYGSAVPALTVSYSPANPAGLTTPPTCSTTATRTSPVGMYPITCTGAVDANYTITYVGGTVSVTPAPLTIWASSGLMTYGGTPPTITASYVGLVAGDTPAIFALPTTPPIVAPTCTTTPVLTSSTPIGTYPTSCTGAVNPNYTISYAAGKVTVAKAALTITSNATRTYGTPNPSPLPLTPAGLVNGDTLTTLGIVVTCTTTATTSSPVASYPITCTGPASTTNYNITYVPGTLTITPAPASVTPNAATKIYGTADPNPLTTGTLTGFLPADSVTAVYTRAPGETVAGGPYLISATLNPAGVLGNYAITYNTANFTITQAAASVSPNAATKVYGTADPNPLTTGTLTGFLPADSVTAVYTRAPGETVAGGPYLIRATLNPAGVLGNYAITYNTANFTITQAAASVSPNAVSKVYGTIDPALTGTLTGFLPADGVTATYSRVPGENVGSYTISATLAPIGVLANYAITNNTAIFTITAAAASVTPNAAGKNFGGVDPTLTGTLFGFRPADNVVATYARTPGEAVGSYTISATLSPAAVLGNYTITSNTAAFTIAKATSTTTITAHTPNPSAVNQAVTVSFGVTPQFSGVPTGSVTVTANTGESCTAALTAGAGSCPVTLLSPGSKTLTATYGGDASFQASVSLGVTQGVGGAVAFVNPPALTFANQLVNTTSGIQTTTLSNLGSAALTITSITVTGANAANFTRTTACGGTLAAGRSCTISVRFRPTTAGLKTAAVSIVTNDPVNPTLTVGLSGTGVAPIASLSALTPSPLTALRGATAIGTVTLTETSGLAPLTIARITIGGTNRTQFTLTNGCGTSLAAGASCTLTITFHPPTGTARGAKTATLTVRDNSNGVAGSTQAAALPGTAQ